MTIQQSRGYSFERTLVKRFNSVPHWNALRLGSPSVALPDVLAVNDNEKTIIVIEAKERQSSSADIPPDQLQRCLTFMNRFGLYEKRLIVAAFKFINKETKYDSHTKREYYFDATSIVRDPIPTLRCRRDGSTFKSYGTNDITPITLPYYNLPC